MGSRKLTHQLISDNTRIVTFINRKDGLLKKLSELTILCDLDACAIIYSDYEEGPEVWPNRKEVLALLNQLSAVPVEKQTKYMMDQKDLMNMMIQDAKKLEKEQMHKLGLIASSIVLKDADYSDDLIKAAEMVEKRINVESRV